MKYCVHFLIKDDAYVLLHRAKNNPFYPNVWTPVIGKVKPNEEHIEAIKRETIEEVSLTIDNPLFYKNISHNNDEYWIYYSYITQSDFKNIELNHENDLFSLFKHHELPSNTWEFFKVLISKISFI